MLDLLTKKLMNSRRTPAVYEALWWALGGFKDTEGDESLSL